MMRGGLWVLNVMPLVWCAAGLFLSGLSLAWLAVAVVVSLALLMWEQLMVRGAVPQPGGAHVGRVVGIWIAVETVAIVVASNVLVNMHRPDAIMPAIAIIVGLHFFGLAKGIPVRPYYATGAGLVAVGIIALVAPQWHLPLMTGVMAAAVLWISGIALARSV